MIIFQNWNIRELLLFKKTNRKALHNKVVLPILLGILVVGITQFTFAEELEKATYIAVDEKEIEPPKSTYKDLEIIIRGHIEDYNRGFNILITIINPDESEEELVVYATKNGDIFTLFTITKDSQFGTHQVILKYNSTEIASTSFEILDNRSDFERWKDNRSQ